MRSVSGGQDLDESLRLQTRIQPAIASQGKLFTNSASLRNNGRPLAVRM